MPTWWPSWAQEPALWLFVAGVFLLLGAVGIAGAALLLAAFAAGGPEAR